MIVGDMPEAVDLLVAGAGPGGYVAAIAAAQLGRSVTVVDRDDWGGLGGACLHVGCIPSKALIELGESARRASGSPGLLTTGLTVDLAAFQAHKRGMIDRLAGGVRQLLRHHGVEVVTGALRFAGLGRATVVGTDPVRHLEYEDVIVAVGSRPVALDATPFDGVRVLDSAGLLALEDLPATASIVGGGFVGLELGIALAKLGTTVTVVEAQDRLLAGLDADMVRPVQRTLRRLGVETLLGTVPTGVDGNDLVVVGADGGERRIAAERICVAVGRRPNTDDLGLDLLGVSLDERGLVSVDAARLAQPHVAAIGDVTAGPALAHKATAEAQVAVRALSGVRAAFAPRAIPVVMFTDPEIATTGLTLAEAQATGLDAFAETFPQSALGRAAAIDRREGFVRLVAERGSGEVVGAQIAGAHASELIAEATLAVEMGATLEDVALTIHAHPTLAEGIGEAADLALGRPVHVVRRA